MIQFSKLGKKGRLGNALFQLASTIGIARSLGTQANFPKWQYEPFFVMRLQHSTMPFSHKLTEPHFHYADGWVNDQADIEGWLQSEKYWIKATEEIKGMLRWEGAFRRRTEAKCPPANGKRKIAISVRRGDYVNNPNYYQLPAAYYYLALLQHFPHWQHCQLLFFSDDMDYCQLHFGCLPNAFFAHGINDIEQLCLMSQCDDFIIAHSTFSWWGAWLGEKDGSKIIRPNYLFAGKLLAENDDKDFWPARWTAFDHVHHKLDLRDVTFTIPVQYDHDDRRQNLELAVCMLQRDFDTNIIVGEQGGRKMEHMGQWCKYVQFDMPAFHRTKMLNDMCNMSQTPIVANYDCDVILPPLQLYMAVQQLRKQDAQMVYPYDGRFGLVERRWFARLESALDIGILGSEKLPGTRPTDARSVGGAVLVDKDAFAESGMENEYFISYGPEDCERYDRWQKLGYKVARVTGALYHINHFRGPDSGSHHDKFQQNNRELDKIRKMTADELKEAVAAWPWVNSYNTAYYQSILMGALQSAKEVFALLKKKKITPATVIDIGCGLGEWGVDQPFEYTGIDWRANKKKLLIDPAHYVDYDLSSNEPFPITQTFDLCICLEVAEHLPIESAAGLVALLCKLSSRVLFSAAIPYQGGTGHINEQWQSWWAIMFEKNGYKPAQVQLRNDMLENENIEVWYKQNIILYEKNGKGAPVKNFVHYQQYINIASHMRIPVK